MNEKVMIIDDDPKVLESLMRVLRIEGIQCFGESDPILAIQKCKVDPPDVVVVDYIYDAYPDINGLDVISEIRKIKPLTQTILISGRINHADLDRDKFTDELKAKIRCDYYLAKPVSNDDLINAVKSAMRAVADLTTDWKSIANEYVENQKVDPDKVRELNESIKGHILKTLNKNEGE
jgi:DNA-binding response OmpR family regulator